MTAVGIVVAALAAFVASSGYYTLLTPLERRAAGPSAPDRGRPAPWKVAVELLRTALVATVFAGLAHHGHDLALGGAVVLALVVWLGFPVVLLTGSAIWENVHPATAGLHVGDWLLKLLLIAVVVGLLH